VGNASARKAAAAKAPAAKSPAAKAHARRARQSNFELLRIVAMLMIVAHHMVRFASPGLDALPLGAKWLYFFAIETGGEVGVDVFLIISVWFLAGRAQTLRSALRHVAKTEAVVLFYSLSLYVLSKYVLRLQGLPGRLSLQSSAPTVTGLWWYITCYTLVVLVSPFLVKGLRSLGQSMHRQLVVVELVVVSVLPMLDVVDLYVNAYVSFLAIVVMVTYVRWYPPALLERPAVPWLMIAAGLVASVLLGATVRLLVERGVPFMTKDPMYWEWSPGSPLVLCEAFGLFLVFSRLRLTNRAVNFLARSTVGVYLIHEHPGMRILLWQRLLPFEGIYGSGLFLLGPLPARERPRARRDLRLLPRGRHKRLFAEMTVRHRPLVVRSPRGFLGALVDKREKHGHHDRPVLRRLPPCR
jgi:hypothetical protein